MQCIGYHGRMRTVKTSLLLLALLPYTLKAAYTPEVNVDDYPKEEIRKGVLALKALPITGKECCIAEKMGLVFSPGGGSGYTGEEKTNVVEHTKFYTVKNDTLYIGSNGKVYNFSKEMHAAWDKRTLGKSNKDSWIEAKQAIGATGEDAIFAAFAKDVTKLAQQTAKYHLKNLPAKLRDAWLARYGGLLYMPDGSDAYNGTRSYRRYGTVSVKQPVIVREYKSDALFTDSKGEELNVNEIWGNLAKTDKIRGTLEHITWCASLVGAEDILNLFPKEVKAMRKYHKEAIKRVSKAPASPSEVVTKSDSPTVARLQQIPRTTREAIIAEFLDLTYMPNGEYPLDSRKWTRHGAHFVGSDGVDYDFWQEHDRISGEQWSQIVSGIRAEGTEIVFAPFAQDIAAMKAAAAKR